jgi:hypothetical protein
MMADSTLDPDYLTSGRDRSLGRGHGTDALGPSDLSDTGSDMQGAGLSRDVGLGMDEGTTSGPDRSSAGGTAGPDVGDANLDSDTDSGGTGERAAAGRDSIEADGDDIDVDQVENVETINPDDIDVDQVEDVEAINPDDTDVDAGR